MQFRYYCVVTLTTSCNTNNNGNAVPILLVVTLTTSGNTNNNGNAVPILLCNIYCKHLRLNDLRVPSSSRALEQITFTICC